MNDEDNFLRAIQADPDDAMLRLVYADWLEEQGDVRGEYLRLTHQLTQFPSRLQQLKSQIDPNWLTVLESGRIKPRLRVRRGAMMGVEWPIYDGQNIIGRADDQPTDIDVSDQEPSDRIYSSLQHAVIHFENNKLAIEDLNSANGTFVNRNRVIPGQRIFLQANDIVQIGNVHLIVLF